MAARHRRPRHGARHLRRVHAARRAVHRRPALRPPPPGRAGPQARLRRQHRPGARVLPVPPRRGRPDLAAAPRSGRLLRLLDRPRAGGPPGHGRRAGGVRDQRRGRPPRGRGRPARDRLRVRRRAQDRRQRDHLQVRAQGDRPAARPVRDVHAQADPRHQRLGDAHPPEPVLDRRRPKRVRRREGAVRPVRRRAQLHGRDPRPRPGHDRRPRAAREQLQAAGAGLRGADLHHLGPHEPQRAHPRPDDLARQVDRGHPLRGPLPGPVVQHLPRLRRDDRGRPRRRGAGP